MGAALYPVAARPIPGPLVADLASGSEMARVYELMAEVGAQRVRADAAEAECAEVRGQLQESRRLVDLLQAKVARMEGKA